MKPSKPPVPAPRQSQESSSEEERPQLPARPRKEQVRPEDSAKSDQKQLELLKEFALRKNFTEAEFEEAVKRTSLIFDTNLFFSQLIAVSAERGTKEFTRPTNQNELRPRSTAATSEGLRNIVIDGSNVAMTHGNGQVFSSRGIQIAVEWFQQRGHSSIKVFVPSHRKEAINGNRDVDILHSLEAEGQLTFTPSWESSDGTRITCYDDRFILKCASDEKAIVVSNDHFKDLASENSTFKDTIDHRLLTYIFATDCFMPAEDPMGRKGLTLGQFLRVNAMDTRTGQCPYGRKCTYGTKCKYSHAERQNSAILTDAQLQKRTQRDKDLHEYIQRTQKEDNNNIQPTQQTRLNVQMNHFGNHPSNVQTLPTLVSRGVGEQVNSEPSPRQQPSTTGPNRIILKVDNSVHKMMPVHNANQIPNINNYAPQVPSYVPTYPHFNHPNIQQCQLPASNIQPVPIHYNEQLEGMNGLNRNRSQPHQNTGNDFTNPSHPRYNTYFHLKNLFPEKQVRTAMTQMPNETDSQALCKAIMELL